VCVCVCVCVCGSQAPPADKRSYVFLFNYGVICCKAKGQYYHFKAAIDLDQLEFTIEDLPGSAVPRAESDSKVRVPMSLLPVACCLLPVVLLSHSLSHTHTHTHTHTSTYIHTFCRCLSFSVIATRSFFGMYPRPRAPAEPFPH
jgi:hypothetical protein